jgi:quercetin dioxygenase-like cupin family protein
MIVKSMIDVLPEKESPYPGIQKKFYLGKQDGSNEIIMRFFSVDPGNSTPFHQHPFPHLVKVESGSGVLVDENKKESELKAGSLVYINDNEWHCFKNTGNAPFEFICIVPERGEK